jgi:fucose 4-O-acetylase-like acetyltransferase
MRSRSADDAAARASLTPNAALRRRPEIDILRVVAMLVVLVVHSAEPFNPWDDWHVRSPERSRWLGELVLFLAPWVMPLFMLLAGASAWHSLGRRSARAYVHERVTRVLLPLAAGILILVPPQMYIDRRERGLFDGSLLEFYPHFFDGLYPNGNFGWLHLWFLGLLALFALITLPLFRWLRTAAGRRVTSRLATVSALPAAIMLVGMRLV